MTNNKAIRIVHILEGFTGGTSTYICSILPQLTQKGFEVTLVCSLNRCCSGAQDRLDELQTKGVKVHITQMHREIRPLKDFYSFASLLLLLLKNKYDLVHTHSSKAGAIGRIAAALAQKTPVVHSPHCFAFLRCNSRFKKSFYFVVEQLLGKLTTKLVAVSQAEAALAVNSHIVPVSRCVWINNGLSNGLFRPQASSSAKRADFKALLGVDKDTLIVSTGCRLVEYKGVFRFLEAAGISRTRNAVFLLAGEGKLKTAAEKFIHQNKLRHKVRMLGHISNMDIVYSVTDLVVLCSDAEAQPYVLLEAMRAKCPIVATSVIGNRDLISHGETGFLAEPDPAAIAAAIDELLADEKKRRQYAENAYTYFCTEHSLEKQVAELTEIYKSCIRRRW